MAVEDFNSYGSRRGNDRVMMRGTFANVRIKNLMVPGVEGGVHRPSARRRADEHLRRSPDRTATGRPAADLRRPGVRHGVVRDWAAKGTSPAGRPAVVAQSFERIHRSNLVGMGVLPCQFKEGVSAQTLGLDGTETFDLVGLEAGLKPRQDVTLVIQRARRLDAGGPADAPH